MNDSFNNILLLTSVTVQMHFADVMKVGKVDLEIQRLGEAGNRTQASLLPVCSMLTATQNILSDIFD